MKSVGKINISEMSRTIAYRKLLVLIILMCGSASMVRADYFNLAWGIQYGGAADEVCYADVQVDIAGNIYTIWSVRDGSNTTTYMRKIDNMGNIIWTKSEVRNYMELPFHLKMNSQDDYCIFGWTDGPSGGTYYGSSDGFVRKYNSDGQLLWSRQQGTSGYDTGHGGRQHETSCPTTT